MSDKAGLLLFGCAEPEKSVQRGEPGRTLNIFERLLRTDLAARQPSPLGANGDGTGAPAGPRATVCPMVPGPGRW